MYMSVFANTHTRMCVYVPDPGVGMVSLYVMPKGELGYDTVTWWQSVQNINKMFLQAKKD